MVSISDRWEQGDPYERYIGRWSRRVAPAFLKWLAVPAGRRWLDLGCGTGALAAAIAEHAAPSALTCVEPSAGFLRQAKQQLGTHATLLQGDGASIPLADGAVDVTVSGLVLNFIPDTRAALAQMKRVTAKGGLVAAYVWDYADGMELIRRFWDAAAALDPQAAPLHEGARFALCRPAALQAAFSAAGLSQIDTGAIMIDTPFESFDDYWSPFLGGQGPAPSYVMALSEAARGQLRDRLRQSLPATADGRIALTARAWAVRGVRAA